jgi:hypothetical protein
MAKKYRMVIFTNAVEGKDKEYNDWYQNTHLKQIVSIKSFVQAQRFRFHTNIIPGSANPSRYMAIYDIETDDINATLGAMNEMAASGRMPLPDSMAPPTIGAVYEEFGEAVRAR